ncbi:MAG: substrate-binding domain-containing protein [Clostridiales Family XIII bacterium]|nr:substrate-binding domain-containing protein [Clostridiales Family XIII bacterium]
MNKRSKLAMLIALVMVLSLTLAACRGTDTPAPADSGSSAPAAEPAPAGDVENPDADKVLTAEELADHEIYKHLGDNALLGLTPPFLKDRSAQNKALPVEQKSDVKVGWSEAAMVSPWFAGIQQGAEQFAKQYGYDLLFTDAIAWDVTKQTSDVENLITQGIDILVIDPVDVQAQSVDIAKAIDAGIPVISLYPLPEDSPVITAVTANYFEVSYAAGFNAAQIFEDPISSVFIPGQVGHPIADSRTCGFLAGWCYGKQVQAGTAKPYREDGLLAGYNAFNDLVKNGSLDITEEFGLKVLGMANGNFDDAGGQAAAEDLLTAHPDIQMLFADNDHQCAGAIKVLEQRGLLDQVEVVTGCDADMNMLELVRDGKLTSTGYNNPIAITKAVFELINMIYEQGYDANNLPTVTEFYYELYTIDNWQNVYEEGTDYGKVFDTTFRSIPELNELAAEK